MTTAAAIVRDVRRRANLTQEQLADRLDVSVRMVQLWECGDYEPRADQVRTLAHLAGAAGVSIGRDGWELLFPDAAGPPTRGSLEGGAST